MPGAEHPEQNLEGDGVAPPTNSNIPIENPMPPPGINSVINVKKSYIVSNKISEQNFEQNIPSQTASVPAQGPAMETFSFPGASFRAVESRESQQIPNERASIKQTPLPILRDRSLVCLVASR
jgi:hypothetical protein